MKSTSWRSAEGTVHPAFGCRLAAKGLPVGSVSSVPVDSVRSCFSVGEPIFLDSWEDSKHLAFSGCPCVGSVAVEALYSWRFL